MLQSRSCGFVKILLRVQIYCFSFAVFGRSPTSCQVVEVVPEERAAFHSFTEVKVLVDGTKSAIEALKNSHGMDLS